MSEKLLDKKTSDKKQDISNGPVIFGIRHLSPAGAWHLRRLLDKVNPKIVLIEGPSDCNEEIEKLADRAVNPPIAIMAYTMETPIDTILYPLSIYSPEYQAVLWSKENKVKCRFIDLPSDVFLAFSRAKKMQMLKRQEKEAESETKEDLDETENSKTEENLEDNTIGKLDVYKKLDEVSGEDTHETFWEYVMEHFSEDGAYYNGASSFGENLRELTEGTEEDYAETVVREAYMKRQIKDAIDSGIPPEKIVVVTGAYHVKGLRETAIELSDDEIKKLPRVPSNKTVMPYSYYRLSARSGYGAGNKAPAYYELLWDGMKKGESDYAARCYLSKLAKWQRENGNIVSSAEVIEALQLSFSLAKLHGYNIPSLRDLRDAAVTCMGHGNFGEIVNAVASVEIGTKVGSLPKGMSSTSIQNDFYNIIDDLNLRKYCSEMAQDLKLDLRENIRVKSEKLAFLDLNRSFFLHRLNVLGITFAECKRSSQDNATWSESWILRWTPESEIELVEAQLKGDTIVLAASFQMKERLEKETNIGKIAEVIEQSFLCGMEETSTYAASVLQGAAVDSAAVTDIADAVNRLSVVIQYGNIRKISPKPLIPVLEQMYLRACLILPDAAVCDNSAADSIVQSIGKLNEAVLNHDFLSESDWIYVMKSIASRDDLNTKVSGYAAAVLLERGKMTNEELELEVSRRLSKGVPADLGAEWFAGLSLKNRYSLIARLGLWKMLDEYLDTLDDEEFKKALLFLRRAFADFNAKEKSDIAENLGEVWQLNPESVDEVINTPVTKEEQEMINNLDDFDFGDI